MAAVGTQMRSANGGVSRLSMMQAKIRGQLMLEKESRLLEMAARQDAEREDIISRVTKTSASSMSSSMSSLNSSGAGQGRVRKMFEERRGNGRGNGRGYHQSPKGIDKSNPLDPVKRDNYGRTPVRGVVRNGRNASMERGGYNDQAMTRSRSQVNMQRANRGDTRIQRPPKGPTGGRGLTHHRSTSSLLDNNNFNGPSRGPSPGLPSSTKSSPGPRGPPVPPLRRRNPTRNDDNLLKVNGNNRRSTSRSRSPSPSPKPSPRKPSNENKGFFAKLGFNNKSKSEKTPKPTPRSSNMSDEEEVPEEDYSDDDSFESSDDGINDIGDELSVTNNKENKFPSRATTANTPRTIDPKLKYCKICERGFAPDRIQKHQEICAKSKQKQKKRKPFDPVKMRTIGTEAEKFVARGDHLKENKKEKKHNWRKKHEDFIATVRAAKGMKGYVAPPVDTSEYVDCPHCGRKFSEQVADRHIPKCASIESNKAPKSNRAPPRRR